MEYFGRKPTLYKPKVKKDGKEYELPTYYFRVPSKIDRARQQLNTGRSNIREAEIAQKNILDQLIARGKKEVYEEAYLDKAIEPYLDFKKKGLRAGRSYKRYRQVVNEFREHILGQLGKEPKLVDIKLQMAEKYFNWIIEARQSEKSHNDKKAIVSNFFKYCLKQGWLAKNIISDIPDLPEKETEVIPYTKEEAAKITNYLKNEKNPMRRNKGYYEIMCIVFYGGVRISEATHLIGEDLDFKTHTIRIRNKTINGVEYTTKTGRNWLAPMNKELEAILAKWIKNYKIGDNDLLFPNTKGKPIKNDLIAKELKKIMIKLGIPPEKIKRPLHRGRHAFCSHAIEAGIPEPVVQAALGHKTNVMTKHYTHLSPDYMGKAFNKLSYRQKGKKGVK